MQKSPDPSQDVSGTFQVFGEAKGFGIAWHGMRFYTPKPRPEDQPQGDEDYQFFEGEPIDLDLVFQPAKILSGVLKDEKGEPISGAKVSLSSLDYLKTEGREMHPNFREFWGMPLAPARYRQTNTGADGRFEFQDLPAETVGYVRIHHPNYAAQTFYAAITDRAITEYELVGNSMVSAQNGKTVRTPIIEKRAVRTMPIEVQMRSARRVTITAVRADGKEPARDIRIGASAGASTRRIHSNGTTDANGRTVLTLPPGKYQLVANPPRNPVGTEIRTYEEIYVEESPREQEIQVTMKEGCLLIFEAVDADSGSGIPGIGFWYEMDKPAGARTSVQSSTTWVDNPVTNEKGEMRAVVNPGTRRYGLGMTPVPKEYEVDSTNADREIKCEAGKTIRVRFELRKK
jgi:hypothetical protein